MRRTSAHSIIYYIAASEILKKNERKHLGKGSNNESTRRKEENEINYYNEEFLTDVLVSLCAHSDLYIIFHFFVHHNRQKLAL